MCRLAAIQVSKGTQFSEQVIVCEGEHANLSCPEGRYIAIRLANYGRFTISQCNPTFNTELSTTCQNDKTLSILQLR
uniref:SUEL-type lectin domain-containing protein n=1 Tax=Parascaris equorum TaxID=6256 RepID=A0A914RL40_PAREQ